jgi:hypothetical protein
LFAEIGVIIEDRLGFALAYRIDPVFGYSFFDYVIPASFVLGKGEVGFIVTVAIGMSSQLNEEICFMEEVFGQFVDGFVRTCHQD